MKIAMHPRMTCFFRKGYNIHWQTSSFGTKHFVQRSWCWTSNVQLQLIVDAIHWGEHSMDLQKQKKKSKKKNNRSLLVLLILRGDLLVKALQNSHWKHHFSQFFYVFNQPIFFNQFFLCFNQSKRFCKGYEGFIPLWHIYAIFEDWHCLWIWLFCL